jgi:3-hydroxybutyryl-CoA dehydrogenase
MAVNKIFVCGAGQMGSGIVQVALMTGYAVTMQDVTGERVNKAKDSLEKAFNKQMEKGKLEKNHLDEMMSRLNTTTALDAVAEADLIIEAAFEDSDVKKKLFAEFDKLAKPETIFATNTSTVSISEIASATKRPDKVIGMHFFNPAPVMKLLEVVKGYSTSQETIDTVLNIGKKMGKVTILSVDKAGFIVNRLLDPMLNEAIFLLEEGVGTAEDIDNGMKFGCNHPMGPLALADLIGLDVLLAVMEVLYREYADSKYRPAPLLKKMVRAGELGRKAGEGFFRYN